MRQLSPSLGSALCLVMLFCLAAPAHARSEDVDALADFFRPVSAQVIFTVDGPGAVIDKGSEDGIRQGDYLTEVRDETPLQDPRKGDRPDTVKTFGARLVVTRTKPNQSYARLAGEAVTVEEGARVDRFAAIPVYFIDPSGGGIPLFNALRDRLPHLRWAGYLPEEDGPVPADGPRLVIRHGDRQLRVEDREGRILFLHKTAGAVSTTPNSANLSAAATSRSGAGSPPGEPARLPELAGLDEWVARRVEIPRPGAIEALRVADLNGDGQPEILVGIEGGVSVYHLQGDKLVEVARVEQSGWQQIIHLSTLDIHSDGSEEVVVSAAVGGRGETRIFRLEESRLIEISRTSLLVRTFEPVGGPPVLLGMEPRDFLAGRPRFFRLELTGDTLRKQPYALAGVDQPFGVALLATGDDQTRIASLTSDHRLVVYDVQARSRWESGGPYGGSLKGLKVSLEGKRNFGEYEVHYVHARLETTSAGILLATRHEGPGLFRNTPSYRNGRIVALSWNGVGLEKVAETKNLGGFVADFATCDLARDGVRELLAGVQYGQQGFFRKPVSALLILAPRHTSSVTR